ncbi:MAG: cation transporter, partial [Pseudomonadota bacterium]|nr:cation transporter [Pseudomonadota bacterium]
VPAGLDMEKVRAMMLGLPNVGEVHDLHAWALGSKEPILTAHIVLSDVQADIDHVRSSIVSALDAQFGIEHATIQVEAKSCDEPHAHE